MRCIWMMLFLLSFGLAAAAQSTEEEIQAVILGIARAADDGEWDLLKQKFADHVMMIQTSLMGEDGGRPAETDVIGDWADLLPRFDSTEHRITDIEIVAVSRITARATSRYHAIYKRNGRMWEETGRLSYLLKRERNRWVVTAMDVAPEQNSGPLTDLLEDD